MKTLLPAQLEYLYLIIALPIIVCLIFLTPPFQVPDEGAHLLRATSILEGQILPVKFLPHSLGGKSPETLRQFGDLLAFRNMEMQSTPAFHAGDKAVRLDTNAVFNLHPDQLSWSSPLSWLSFPNTAIYSPFGYLPDVVGLGLGKLAHCSILASFYLGRLVNAGVALGCCFLALKLITRGKHLVFALLLLPLPLFFFASLSQDAALIGYSALAVGLTNQISDDLQATLLIQSWRIFATQGLWIMVCLAKVVYLPFLFALPLLLYKNRALAKPAVLWAMLGTLVAILWSLYACFLLKGIPFGYPGADTSLQIHYVVHHPMAFFQAMGAGLYHNDFYIFHLLDLLGYNLLLPTHFFEYLAVGLLLCAFNSSFRNEFPWPMKIGLISLFLLSILGISLVLYLTYDAVGAETVNGIQARYYLPPLLFLSLILSTKTRFNLLFGLAIALFMLVDIGTLYQIALRYYY